MEPLSIAAALASIIVAFILFAFLLTWLWNSTMPDVLNTNTITFWQAVKLMLIVSILFGGANAYHVFPT